MVPLLTTPLPVPHGFTTRLGGVSEGPFASLNLSAATGDDPKRVEENQQRVLATFGHPPVAGLKQVHGTEIRLVEGPGVWEGDGLLTRTPGLLLRVGVADCYPLLLYHPQGAVAALHAGWRGVVGGILPKALALLEGLGLDPKEAHLAIGPGIGGGCYQVGEEVAGVFQQAGLPTFTPDPKAPGKYLLDLEKALILQAKRAGLKEERIYRVGLCTHCEPTLFSHRRDQGKTGHMWGMVMLPR
ncbi:peptidoglycan editing factor PgeF [Thermus caliditerrae]|uniref:peptidoglycan editing factor PgeF n=1 Tax=Thermus caliditerrae TaxID=1330700 RepID=UPI001F1BA30B|nr:peptidoglycan editing factor PgeF [Thermus caliditerrae]